MSKINVAVTLTAYNMGPDATEADFDSWAKFVNDAIDARCGFTVDVDQFAFVGSSSSRDRIANATDEQHDSIREAMVSLWDEWCAQPVVEVAS